MDPVNVSPRVRVPRNAAADEIVTVRALVNHPMESGQRRDAAGQLVPRRIINRFTVTFNGTLVIDVEVSPAVSSNPFFQFEARVPESGTFTFTWVDDSGDVYSETAEITVS